MGGIAIGCAIIGAIIGAGASQVIRRPIVSKKNDVVIDTKV